MIFVTGTGTDIGKTYILKKLVELDKSMANDFFVPFKPLLSGFDQSTHQFSDSDAGLLLQAQGKALNPKNLEQIAPWRYHTPQAPDLAQAKEQKPFSFSELITFCQHQALICKQAGKMAVIEGVGGLMSPICFGKTVLDWIKALDCSVVLVAGTYLGAITHLLTALETLTFHGMTDIIIVLNESHNSTVSLEETALSLSHLLSNKIMPVRRMGRSAQHWRALYERICDVANEY